MITKIQKLNFEPCIRFDLFAPRERIVFADIETTGLKAGKSQLYLIGAAGYENGAWNLHQFFAESPEDEILALQSFREYLDYKSAGQDHLILVTYNGDRFDIPFLKEVEREYAGSGLFRNIVSFDLYKAVKPYKKLTGLPDLKLKTVECFCGVCREDAFDGGELIPVYYEYVRLHCLSLSDPDNSELKTKKEQCLSCLLLHNGEDIGDMLPVMKMLSYEYLFDGLYELRSAEIISDGGSEILDIRFQLKCPLPKGITLVEDNITVSVCGEKTDLLEIIVRILEDELRLYFEDYRNYYYLPAEDIAIHRSLGEFVDRKCRIKATAETCYLKETGKFIEVPEGFAENVNIFRKNLKGKSYIRFQEELLTETENLKLYAMKILAGFLA